MSERPRPHGPMGDGVFTRCRVCMEWWPCRTRMAEDVDAVVDADAAGEFIAEARKALRGEDG